MAYEIALSDTEISTLEWLSERGYFPEEFLDGMTLKDGQPDESETPEQERMYDIPEHVAWSIKILQEEDPDAYLSCLDSRSELYDKIQILENEIV